MPCGLTQTRWEFWAVHGRRSPPAASQRPMTCSTSPHWEALVCFQLWKKILNNRNGIMWEVIFLYKELLVKYLSWVPWDSRVIFSLGILNNSSSSCSCSGPRTAHLVTRPPLPLWPLTPVTGCCPVLLRVTVLFKSKVTSKTFSRTCHLKSFKILFSI